MKTNQLFWGFFFISLGFLSLSTKYDWLVINFEMVRDLWPVLFIIGGLLVIVKDTKLRPFLSIIMGIIIASILFSFSYGIFNDDDSWEDEFNTFDSDISSLFDEEYESAKLTINGGVGEFSINGSTDELYEAVPTGIFKEYEVQVDDNGNSVEVTFDLEDEIDIFNDKPHNKLSLKLNESPVWELELNLGAAASDFDLRNFKVKKIKLATGATKTKIKLGDRLNRTDIIIDMGAAAVQLFIPEKAGCRVISSTFLITKELPGFIKKSDGNFETKNFDEATQKIFVNLRGGLANFQVKTY